MWQCRICKTKNTGAFPCENCGYDPSCDYESYPTLSSALPLDVKPVSALKEEFLAQVNDDPSKPQDASDALKAESSLTTVSNTDPSLDLYTRLKEETPVIENLPKETHGAHKPENPPGPGPNPGRGKYVAAILLTILFILLALPFAVYFYADYQIGKGEFSEAENKLSALNNAADMLGINAQFIKDKTYELNYARASSLMNEGNYSEAKELFRELANYKDSSELYAACEYYCAEHFMNEGNYLEAKELFRKLANYKDSSELYAACEYHYAEQLLSSGNLAGAAIAFGKAEDFSDARDRSFDLWDKVAVRETLSSSYMHVAALKNDGSAVAVGANLYGKYDLSSWNDIISICAGGEFTLGLKSDGTVVAEGDYESKWSGVSEWNDIVSISAAFYPVGLRKNGTVVAIDENTGYFDGVSSWESIIAVSIGDRRIVGLKLDGTVVVVGENSTEYDVSEWSGIRSISAGPEHIVGLKDDGTVIAAGENRAGECEVSQWKDIIAVSAGMAHTIGLKADGSVVVAGAFAELYDDEAWSSIVSISAGYVSSVGLRQDGSAACVFFSEKTSLTSSQLAELTNIRLPKPIASEGNWSPDMAKLAIEKVSYDDLDTLAAVRFNGVPETLLDSSMSSKNRDRTNEAGFSDALTFGFKTTEKRAELELEILRNPIAAVTYAMAIKDEMMGVARIGFLNPWMDEMVSITEKEGIAYWLETRGQDETTVYVSKEFRQYAATLCLWLAGLDEVGNLTWQTAENWRLSFSWGSNYEHMGVLSSDQYEAEFYTLSFFGSSGEPLFTIGFDTRDKSPAIPAESVEFPAARPSKELSIIVDSYSVSTDEMLLPNNCHSHFRLSGTFHYSRDLSDHEMSNWNRGGDLYVIDNLGKLNNVEYDQFLFFSDHDGTFWVSLYDSLPAGEYAYRITHWFNLSENGWGGDPVYSELIRFTYPG